MGGAGEGAHDAKLDLARLSWRQRERVLRGLFVRLNATSEKKALRKKEKEKEKEKVKEKVKGGEVTITSIANGETIIARGTSSKGTTSLPKI